jgi:hypothetical protein
VALTPLNLQGEDGANGTAATVTVGTVTTGAAGSSAAVTNAGTSSAAVLNFTIPRGATGAAGSGTGPGFGETVTLDADDLEYVSASQTNLNIPYADANFAITLSDYVAGDDVDFILLVMPSLTDGDEDDPHWVRLTTTVQDRRRQVGSQWWQPSSAAGSGSILNRPTVIEPGPEPGSATTIDYEWVPAAQQWIVKNHMGDALIRRHESLTGWTQSATFTSALPAYASPELVRNNPAHIDDVLDALAVVPPHIAAALGRQSCWVDLGDATIDECIDFRKSKPGTYAPGGGFRAVGYMNSGAIIARAVGDGYEASLNGFVLLHELAHAIDYYWYPGATLMVNEGTLPTSALDSAGWLEFLYTRPDPQVSADSALIALHSSAVATGTLSAYYSGSAAEWFAQMLAVVLSAEIPGYNSSAWTYVKGQIQGNSTIYGDFVDFLESVYIL